jgi:hypothetical protein
MRYRARGVPPLRRSSFSSISPLWSPECETAEQRCATGLLMSGGALRERCTLHCGMLHYIHVHGRPIERRIEAIRAEDPLTTDAAVILPMRFLVESLLPQLRAASAAWWTGAPLPGGRTSAADGSASHGQAERSEDGRRDAELDRIWRLPDVKLRGFSNYGDRYALSSAQPTLQRRSARCCRSCRSCSAMSAAFPLRRGGQPKVASRMTPGSSRQ